MNRKVKSFKTSSISIRIIKRLAV